MRINSNILLLNACFSFRVVPFFRGIGKKNHRSVNKCAIFALIAVLGGGCIDIAYSPVWAAENNGLKNVSDSFAQLPDGQTLLLRPKVNKFLYQDDIYALKKRGRIYLSLSDVIDILEFSIEFDPKTKMGRGWFLREDWKISLDLDRGVVTSRGQEYIIGAENIVTENGILFIASANIEEWFDLKFKHNISEQYIDIESPYPLPRVARHARQNRKAGRYGQDNVAKLPRKEIEHDWFDLNTAEVRLGTRYQAYDGQPSALRHRGVVAVEGQLLKHNAYGIVNFDDEEQLTSVVARLSKYSEDPTLLGPLKARSYIIGDTNVASIPLTGSSRQELGFRVSNSNRDAMSGRFESTDISGDALPGWDVELYRNGVLLLTEDSDDSGHYQFSDVKLFAGDNIFEIFFYGPQGEIRTKRVSVPVTQELISSQGSTYDVSVTFADAQTYRKYSRTGKDEATPHIAARFDSTLGGAQTYLGFRSREVDGDNTVFAGAGFTKILDSTILDGNVGVNSEGSGAARLTARRNIADWNLIASGQVQGKKYKENDGANPRLWNLSGSVQRNFILPNKTRASIFTSGEVGESSDGQLSRSGLIGGGYQIGRLNISDTLRYSSLETSNNEENRKLNNTLSVKTTLNKVSVRGGMNYEILPKKQVSRYFSQVSYRPTSKFSGDVTLDYQPISDFSRARLNLNYLHSRFRTSPFLEVDSKRSVHAGVNLNFTVVDTPHEGVPFVTSRRAIGQGMVSSFVFYDKNGNMIFDDDDEPLPDVVVESVNIRRRVETNEKGYSLINNLPATRVTDIHIDQDTLPDPYMISGFEGVSILPSAGEIVELEFPIHMSGEIDGSVSIRKKNGALETVKRASVVLHPLYPLRSKNVKALRVAAAFDGFYVASQVPPGLYLMAVTNETAIRMKAAAPMPEIVNIGHDGTPIYGQNFEMMDKQAHVPIEMSYVDPGQLKGVEVGEVIYSLKTGGRSKSKLLSLLSGLARKKAPSDIFSGLQEINFEIGDAKGTKRFITSSNTLEDAHRRCSILAQNAIPCVLEVFVPVIDMPKTIRTASR